MAGHGGMVGTAIVSRLESENCTILTVPHAEVDLRNQTQVEDWLAANKPEAVFLAAGTVGGIHANSVYPAEFIYQNLMIEANVINAAHSNGVNDLLFLGSSCIYPKLSPQPMKESYLLNGHLEPTNEPYAIAKIAGIKLCESYNRQFERNYRCVMPTNLYGPNDNFHPENSHVIPALMRRFHFAKEEGQEEVSIWGTGTARREFLHVDDLASACIHIMGLNSEDLSRVVDPMLSHINVGMGLDSPISEIAEVIASVTGFSGRLAFDASKPDGTPRKLLDVSLINRLGWSYSISLGDGLASTYRWFLENMNRLREG